MLLYSWPSHTILHGRWQNLHGQCYFDLGNFDWYIFQKCKTVPRLYVIKIFNEFWFSQPLGAYSLPTKENWVGGILIIVIIKQNEIFLATFCNFAWKCYYTLQQQCRVIQALCLDNTWPRREAMLWKCNKFPCVEIICVFSSNIRAGEKIPSKLNGLVYFDNIGFWNHRTYSLCA